MENFDLKDIKELAEAYVGPVIHAIYRRLMDQDFAMEDPEVVMLLAALTNILRHDKPWGPLKGSLIDRRLRTTGSTRLPKYEVNEVEKRGTLRK